MDNSDWHHDIKQGFIAIAVFISYIMILQYVSLLSMGLFSELFPENDLLLLSGLIFYVVNFPISLFLSQPIVYAIGLITTLLIQITAIISNPHNITKKALLILGLFAIIVHANSPLYTPSVQAAENYEMIWVTKPKPFLRGLKFYQGIAEETICTYELLGWEQSDKFFYSKNCTHKEPETFFVQPIISPKPSKYIGVLSTSLNSEKESYSSVIDWVYVDGVSPKRVEPSVRDLNIRGDVMLSTDKEWVAVVARHNYGPQDVLLVREAP